jgi:hypothetical protein
MQELETTRKCLKQPAEQKQPQGLFNRQAYYSNFNSDWNKEKDLHGNRSDRLQTLDEKRETNWLIRAMGFYSLEGFPITVYKLPHKLYNSIGVRIIIKIYIFLNLNNLCRRFYE